MRRSNSTRRVLLRAAGGQALEAWVAEGFAVRLAGLAGARSPAPGTALLLPRCRSVHTVGMRFPIDVAFVTWPPAPHCEVLALFLEVAPMRLRAPRGLPRRTAALEAPAGALACMDAKPGTTLSVGAPGYTDGEVVF